MKTMPQGQVVKTWDGSRDPFRNPKSIVLSISSLA